MSAIILCDGDTLGDGNGSYIKGLHHDARERKLTCMGSTNPVDTEVALRVDQIAKVLRRKRLALGVTQQEMARRVDVSARLWAEVERGERPNVSLETALRLLAAVGLRVRLSDVTSAASEEHEHDASLARAAHRRATWTGGRARLGADGDPNVDELSASERLRAVAQVSQLAYAIAQDPRTHSSKANSSPRKLAISKRRHRAT